MSWISPPQTIINQSQRLNNAQLVADYFEGTDWTKESIAALLGNMEYESFLNPNMKEFPSAYNQGWADHELGFGLAAWTPGSKLYSWASANGLDYRNGDTQLARIHYETENDIQWIPNRLWVAYGKYHAWDFTFKEFRTNSVNLSVEDLAIAFMWNYEAPNYELGKASEEDRGANARKWYNLISFDEEAEEKELTLPPPNSTYLPTSPSDPTEEVKKRALSSLDGSLIFNTGQTNKYGNSNITMQKVLNNAYIVNFVSEYVEMEKEKYQNPPPSETIEDPLPPNDDAEIIDGVDRNKPTYPADMAVCGISAGYKGYYTPWGWHAGTDFYPYDGVVNVHKIYAMRDGVVNFVNSSCNSTAGNNLGNNCGGYWGNNVRIRHTNDEYYSLYSHMGTVYVTLGETVKQGQVIGTIGNSGNSTGAHVHVEVSRNGKWGSSNLDVGVFDVEIYLQG